MFDGLKGIHTQDAKVCLQTAARRLEFVTGVRWCRRESDLAAVGSGRSTT